MPTSQALFLFYFLFSPFIYLVSYLFKVQNESGLCYVDIKPQTTVHRAPLPSIPSEGAQPINHFASRWKQGAAQWVETTKEIADLSTTNQNPPQMCNPEDRDSGE